MEHYTNLVTELREAFTNLLNLFVERVTALDNDIDENLKVVQGAYNAIKADRNELTEISAVINEFEDSITDIAGEARNTEADACDILDDMVSLVSDDYITDTDLVVDDMPLGEGSATDTDTTDSTTA